MLLLFSSDLAKCRLLLRLFLLQRWMIIDFLHFLLGYGPILHLLSCPPFLVALTSQRINTLETNTKFSSCKSMDLYLYFEKEWWEWRGSSVWFFRMLLLLLFPFLFNNLKKKVVLEGTCHLKDLILFELHKTFV